MASRSNGAPFPTVSCCAAPQLREGMTEKGDLRACSQAAGLMPPCHGAGRGGKQTPTVRLPTPDRDLLLREGLHAALQVEQGDGRPEGAWPHPTQQLAAG